MIINKGTLIKTNDAILFLKNFNFLLLYKTTVSLLTSDIFISSAGLVYDWLQTNEKKKFRFQTLLETKKIRPKQKKYTANPTSFRIEKNFVVLYDLPFHTVIETCCGQR